MEGDFEDAGKWFARAITGFRQTQDQQSEETVVRNFLLANKQASPEETEKLKAIWSEAGFGPFPEWA
jgi:hypothetical protein